MAVAKKWYFIGDKHDDLKGPSLIYKLMEKAKKENIQVQLLLERDQKRMQWINEELTERNLFDSSWSELPFKYDVYKNFLNFLKNKNQDLYNNIYSSWTDSEFEGKAENRNWIHRIFKTFDSYPVIPIDPSYEDVKSYYDNNDIKNQFNSYQINLFELSPEHLAMASDVGCKIREILMLKNIKKNIEEYKLCVALVGEEHKYSICQKLPPNKSYATEKEENIISEIIDNFKNN